MKNRRDVEKDVGASDRGVGFLGRRGCLRRQAEKLTLISLLSASR